MTDLSQYFATHKNTPAKPFSTLINTSLFRNERTTESKPYSREFNRVVMRPNFEQLISKEIKRNIAIQHIKEYVDLYAKFIKRQCLIKLGIIMFLVLIMWFSFLSTRAAILLGLLNIFVSYCTQQLELVHMTDYKNYYPLLMKIWINLCIVLGLYGITTELLTLFIFNWGNYIVSTVTLTFFSVINVLGCIILLVYRDFLKRQISLEGLRDPSLLYSLLHIPLQILYKFKWNTIKVMLAFQICAFCIFGTYSLLFGTNVTFSEGMNPFFVICQGASALGSWLFIDLILTVNQLIIDDDSLQSQTIMQIMRLQICDRNHEAHKKCLKIIEIRCYIEQGYLQNEVKKGKIFRRVIFIQIRIGISWRITQLNI